MNKKIATGDIQLKKLLREFIETYNRGFPSGDITSWMALWADDAKWVLPVRRSHATHEIRVGEMNQDKHKLAVWAKEFTGTPRSAGRFTETRSILHEHMVIWEGMWETGYDHSDELAQLPLVMLIEFNEEGKITRLQTYSLFWKLIPE